MTVSIEGNPALTLRAWAKAYRDWPMEFRFLSDPHAEFFPRDLDRAADEIERLRAALENARRDLFTIGPKKGSRSPLRKIIEEAAKRIEIALGSDEQKARPKED